MSYTLTLQCGCVVYVSAHPKTRIAHTRVIQSRGSHCSVRRHEIGLRLNLWELLPDPHIESLKYDVRATETEL
jgi:hypothetical protein